ncbi:MAG TPA: hypothetical protein VGJ44_24220 [Kribbellaceae bacterium]
MDAMTRRTATPSPGTPAAHAVADLARRLGVGSDAISVVSVEEVTWPDGSLGCPEPGMAYTQMLEDGQRIVLEHGGTSYEYHSGGHGEPFLCEHPGE